MGSALFELQTQTTSATSSWMEYNRNELWLYSNQLLVANFLLLIGSGDGSPCGCGYYSSLRAQLGKVGWIPDPGLLCALLCEGQVYQESDYTKTPVIVR